MQHYEYALRNDKTLLLIPIKGLFLSYFIKKVKKKLLSEKKRGKEMRRKEPGTELKILNHEITRKGRNIGGTDKDREELGVKLRR